MYTDYKTPYRTQHDDGSWTVRVVVSEGDYTKAEFDPDTKELLPDNGYERGTVLSDEVLTFPRITEAAMIQELDNRLALDRSRTIIPEQRSA